MLVLCLFLVGCGKNKGSDVKKDLISDINNLKAYNLNGKLEVVNNDDVEIKKLELETKIPVVNIVKDFIWEKDIFYAEEYAFSADINNKQIKLSDEHEEYKWLSCEEAKKLLKYDSNKSALWELDVKLKR